MQDQPPDNNSVPPTEQRTLKFPSTPAATVAAPTDNASCLTDDPEALPLAPPTPPASRLVNRTPPPEVDIPNNVSTIEQLKLLPDEFLSGDKDRPLRHVDDRDSEFHYALNPITDTPEPMIAFVSTESIAS